MFRRDLVPRPLEALVATLSAPGWRRVVVLRRTAASALACLALVLALWPAADTGGVPVAVAAHDLDAGATLTAADLRTATYPAALAPTGALTPDAAGQVLAGPLRAGEPVTDLRIAGPELVARLAGPEAAAVPVRPADPAVAQMLRAGDRVDVVTLGVDGHGTVVAGDAAVLTVLPPDDATGGRLVLVALPRETATQVAAASLADTVTLTLR